MAGSVSDPTRSPLSRSATWLYGGAITAVIALHLATNAILGFHIDELYYLSSGRHPAFGYVDFPPIVPLLARIETGLLGVTPRSLRLVPALLSGLIVTICGAYVARLGGSLKLQALALLIGITAPAIVGTWLFQTVVFDQVTWMISLYLFLCLAIEPKPRTWVLLGLTLGVGVEVKYTVVALIVGIGIAVLVTPSLRQDLRTRYPWIAGFLILLISLPNLVWQDVNGFPSLTYVRNHSGGGSTTFVVYFLLILLLLAPLWVAGFVSLFRDRALRAVGIACVTPLAVFLVIGKFYYPAPTVPIVMAAGLLALSHLRRRALRSILTTCTAFASLLGFVALAKITVPSTPASRLHATRLDTLNSDFALTVGWESITQQMTSIYGALPPSERGSTVIVSSDYGVAGALQIYGQSQLLPDSFSPQLSDFFWLPRKLAATNVLMVGYSPSDVTWMCRSVRIVAHLTVPYQVVNLEQGTPVTFCNLQIPLPDAWSRLRNFS